MNEITYCVEIADMKAFQRHHRRTSAVHRRLRIFLVLLFVGFGLDSTLRQANTSVGYRVLYFLVILGIYALVFAVISGVVHWIAQFRAYRGAENGGVNLRTELVRKYRISPVSGQTHHSPQSPPCLAG